MHLDFSIKSDLSNVTLHQIKFSQGKILNTVKFIQFIAATHIFISPLFLSELKERAKKKLSPFEFLKTSKYAKRLKSHFLTLRPIPSLT